MISNSIKWIVIFSMFLTLSTNATTNESNSNNTTEFQTLVITNFRLGLQGQDPITNLCQSATQNTSHFASFSVSGTVLNMNDFVLEISNDNFSNPSNTIELELINNRITFSGGVYTMNFTLPNTIYGSGYRLRVRNSNQSGTAKTTIFSAYYIKHDEQIPVTFSNCSGSSTTISIVPTGSDSPIPYGYTVFRWTRRVNNVDTTLFGETMSSITVNQPGDYFVETEYGECTPSFNSRSRLVNVTTSGGSSLQITAENGATEVCQNPGVVLTMNVAFNPQDTYKWFLNGDQITTAPNSNTFTATQGGTYSASYTNTTCNNNPVNSNVITLNEVSFNASLNVASPYQLAVGSNFDAIVTTDANTPEFTWIFNGTPLSETSNTLNIDALGEYVVQIRQTVGCISSKELTLVVIGPDVSDIPNLISPNGDGINDLFKVPFQYISENNLNLEIYNSSGKQIFITDNYQNNWPQDTNLVFQSNAFFYFKMSKDNQTIKEGILTIIK